MGYRVRHVADLASKGGHPGGEERSTLPWPSPGSCGDDPVGSAPRSNRLSGTSPARPCWRSHASGLWRPATIGVTPPAGPAEMQWTSPWRLGTARRRRSVASLGGVDDLCPHWAQNRRKNDAKRGRLGAKTGPKVCKTDPRADKYGRVLAMESHAAETFVNQSFRASPEGSAARQLTFGDCVQGGQRADCQLTVSSFLGVLVWRQGTEKAVPHRDRVAAAIQQGEAARRAGGHAPGAAGLLHPGTHFTRLGL